MSKLFSGEARIFPVHLVAIAQKNINTLKQYRMDTLYG